MENKTRIEDIMKQLMYTAKTKDEINEKSNLTFKRIQEAARTRTAEFGDPRDILEHPAEFIKTLDETKIDEGCNLDAAILNENGMLQGCHNRIHITDDPEEFESLYKGAFVHLRRLHDYVMHKRGHVVLETREPWQCNLKRR